MGCSFSFIFIGLSALASAPGAHAETVRRLEVTVYFSVDKRTVLYLIKSTKITMAGEPVTDRPWLVSVFTCTRGASNIT